MNKKLKFTLSVECNDIDGDVIFLVQGADLVSQKDQVLVYQGEHDVRSVTRISIQLLENRGTKSHLKLMQVEVNGIELDNWQKWTRYVLDQGSSEYSHGWMSRPGTLYLNLHGNPLSHNYLSYFLSACTTG